MATAFKGLRVLSLESRRAVEIDRLIRAQGGVSMVAPSMREVPLEDNPEALRFAERLFRGEFDMMILLTGVGTRLLGKIIETRWPPGSFADGTYRRSYASRAAAELCVEAQLCVEGVDGPRRGQIQND